MVLNLDHLSEQVSTEVTGYYRSDKTVAYEATVKIGFPEYEDVYHPLFSGQIITVVVSLSKAWRSSCAGAVVLSPRSSEGQQFLSWLKSQKGISFVNQFYDLLFKQMQQEHGEIMVS